MRGNDLWLTLRPAALAGEEGAGAWSCGKILKASSCPRIEVTPFLVKVRIVTNAEDELGSRRGHVHIP